MPPPPPPPPGAKRPPHPPGSAGPPRPPPPAATPLKLRALYWNKVPRQPDTVWEDLAPVPPLVEPYATALAQLFSVKQSSKAETPGSALRRERAAPVVKVIQLPRANNISIMLTQFSNFQGAAAIREALLCGSDRLGQEHLSTLMQIAPTDDERRALARYRGPYAELSPPEQFLMTMCDVPRLDRKISALIFRKQFRGLCDDARAGLGALQEACAQIRGSKRLQQVLSVVLASGNMLNSGSHRGQAESVKLDVLSKLGDVKVVPGFSSGVAAATAGGGKGGAEPAAQQEQQQGAANGAGPEAGVWGDRPPQVKTLLEFVAWVVVRQAQAQQGTRGKERGQGNGSNGSSRLSRAARHGYLGEELGSLGDAVRRMQTDVLTAIKQLNLGLREARAEYEAELENPTLLPAPGHQPQATAHQRPEGPGDTGTQKAPVALSRRQASFKSNIEAAAGLRGGEATQDVTPGSSANPPAAVAGEGQRGERGGMAGGDRGLAEPPAGPEECPPSEVQAAEAGIAGDGRDSDGRGAAVQGCGDSWREGEGEGIAMEPPAPDLAPFAATLGAFLEEAGGQQDSLQRAQQVAEAEVRATVGWLGESPELDPAPTFEMLLNFCMEFDQALRRVARMVGK